MEASQFSSPITYAMVSKPIIDCLEKYDHSALGVVHREVTTRIMSLAISFFQAADCIQHSMSLIGKSTAIIANRVGIPIASQKEVATFSLQEDAIKVMQCALGALFGSFLSVISPSCFVPFLFAPKMSLMNDPVESHQKYTFDDHFTKTVAINLEKAIQKRKVLQAHLADIGLKSWERLDAVNGYELSDDFHIEGCSISFRDAYMRMPGRSEKHKRARTGCYLSHLNALKKARDEDLESVLIIEDDVVFAQNKRGVESFTKTMEELPQDWDIVFLGWEHDRKPVRYSQHVDKAESGTCLHAYGVHKRCYDRLIADLERALQDRSEQLLPVDEVVSESLERGRYKAFAPHAFIGFQRDGLQSNITGNINADYALPRKIVQRIYAYMLAPVLSQVGLPKYRLYKTAARIGGIFGMSY